MLWGRNCCHACGDRVMQAQSSSDRQPRRRDGSLGPARRNRRPYAMTLWNSMELFDEVARATAKERARIRRLIGPALRELRDAISEQNATGTCHQTRRLYGYAETIDAATQSESKRKARK